MVKTLLLGEGVIIGFARKDLYQTSAGYSPFSKGSTARLRTRSLTLLNKITVYEVFRLWGEWLIWISIVVLSPFSSGGSIRVFQKLPIFDNHLEIT